MKNHERGQVLALFALMLTVLLGMLAIAVDISGAYSARRAYRTAADAAALAGGQDLQVADSRVLTNIERTAARTHAVQSLVEQFGADSAPTAAGCVDLSVDIADCVLPGTPFEVSVKTPVTACVRCDPDRSIQVDVHNRHFSLSFARIFGMNEWSVGVEAVAGLSFSGQYALVTLRPPVSGLEGNQDDIRIDGTNSAVSVVGGDIGVNTGATLNGHDAIVQVDGGYFFRHYGEDTDEASPAGATKQLSQLITDPNYSYPSSSPSTPTGGSTPCPPTLAATLAANGYGTYLATDLVCLKPGVYGTTPRADSGKVTVLMPGVYFLNKGFDVKGTVIGGYEPSSPGVALVIPYTEWNPGLKVTATVPFLSLNRGTAFDGRAGGVSAFGQVFTNETVPVTISVVVTRNPACPVVVPAPTCTNRSTFDTSGVGGHGFLSIDGVVYAPSDNVEVSGNGDARGYLGRIVAWTITYSGGSILTQHYLGGTSPGLLRLDGACTAPSTPCD